MGENISTKKAFVKARSSFPSLPVLKDRTTSPFLWDCFVRCFNTRWMIAGSKDTGGALTILWRIENLSRFQRGFHGNGILSPYFYPHTLEENWTQLCLVPRGKSADDGNVHLHFSTTSPFPVNCEFSIEAWDGSPLVTGKGTYRNCSSSASLEMIDCLTQEELFVTKKSMFLSHDTLTVRCRVWKSNGKFSHDEFVSTRSRIELAEGSLMGPITKFSQLNLNQNETFPVELQFMHESVVFDLEYSLTGDSVPNSELHVIVTAGKILKEYQVKLEVSISDNRHDVIKLGKKEKSFSFTNKRKARVPKLELRENLKEKMSLLKCGKTFSLNFRLTAVCKDVSKCIEKTCIATSNLKQDSARTTPKFSEASCQTSEQMGNISSDLQQVSFSEASCQTSEQRGDTPPDLQRKNDCLSMLGEDFFSLYQDQTFSNFELRSGDVSFPVHKNILCARSPVFRSMFSSMMKGSDSEFLDIPDLDVHTLNRMLTFLYKGSVELDLCLESATKLYYAADKYQIDTLKQLCSSILQSQISVSNASDILTLADTHQDSDLTSSVHNFILSHFDDVMDSEEWETFLDINPALAGKSMHLLYKERRERKKKPPKD